MRIRRQPVEVVPFRLQEADRVPILTLQFDPVDIVETVGEEIVQFPVEVPMFQLAAVQQHDRRGNIIVATIMPGTRDCHDRLTTHVAVK